MTDGTTDGTMNGAQAVHEDMDLAERKAAAAKRHHAEMARIAKLNSDLADIVGHNPAPPAKPEPPQLSAEEAAFLKEIGAELNAVAAMLLNKNRAYGNSVFDPVRVFSKADALEQINVRLDDKLSRLMRGEAAGEDTERDLIGYLVLKRIAARRIAALALAAQAGARAAKLAEALTDHL